MKSFRDLPIKWKLMLLITAVSVGVLIASITASLLFDRYKFRQNLANELLVLSETIQPDLRAAILFGYTDKAELLLQTLSSRKSIIAACVYAGKPTPFAQFSNGSENSSCPESPGSIGHHFTPHFLDYISEIASADSDEKLGELLLRSDFSVLEESFIADAYFFLSILAATSILAFLLSTRLHHVVSDPIRSLADIARQVTRKSDFSIRAERKSNDEVGELVTSFNEMMSGIEQRDRELETNREELRQSRNQLEEYNIILESQVSRSLQTVEYLRGELKENHSFGEIIGDSPALQKLLEDLSNVADTDATILIQGETGTGKELLARAVHNGSARNEQPLIAVNCAALPRELIESELFGHEKGAFSGASDQRKGRFELADKGSIFLDEVSELSREAQAKLLRVLQEQEFERVGGTRSINVDVRVIAATNKDLQAAVKAGTFRDDLYYRLNVFTAKVPPLRERSEDISLLARHFAEKYAASLGKAFREISPAALVELRRYSWPGNVRELENVIERSVILSRGPLIEIEGTLHAPESRLGIGQTLEEMEREYIIQVLEDVGWVVEGPQGAAVILGLNPSTLRSRIKKLGINISRAGNQSA